MPTPTGGLATLGDVTWRLNPSRFAWSTTVKTAVQYTVGGRVVQVLGAEISDLVIYGLYGQDVKNSAQDGPGIGWRLAEDFVGKIIGLAKQQSNGANQMGLMAEPLVFTYPPKNWNFDCYIKEIADAQGGNVTHRTGRFSYDYTLTLFIVTDNSGTLTQVKDAAITSYIARLTDGVGWKKTVFNDPLLQNDIHGTDVGINNHQSIFSDPASTDPTSTTPVTGAGGVTPGTYGGYSLDAKQAANAGVIYSVGAALGASSRDILIALMVAIDESNIRALGNPYTTPPVQGDGQGQDRDSVGVFQQRPSQGWGTPAQCLDVNHAATMFFKALLAVGNRNDLSPGAAAQTVQRSGTPDGSNYTQYQNQAQAILDGMKKS